MPPADHNFPVIISGAGIAGLTCALSLSAKGFNVVIVEKAEKLEAIGAGLQISPNAYKVLASLGLKEELDTVSTFPEAIHVQSGSSGKRITSIPLGDTVNDKFGAPYCVVHRGDLQRILLDACKRSKLVEIRYAAEIANVSDDGDGVKVRLSTGTNSISANALVVADGVWSKLRMSLLDAPPPVYTGKTAWRTMFKAEQISDKGLLRDTHIWLAPNSHLVTYPVRDSSALNVILICTRGLLNTEIRQSHDNAELANHLNKFGGAIRELPASKTNWNAWPIYETPKPIQMARGRIAMIGDAAHSMLPFAAQGAGMAIEDAQILPNCLENAPATEAFHHFAKLRTARVERVVKLARNNGRIYHMSPPLSFCRDIAMKMLPSSGLLKRQAWIYSWKP
ncbi:MAG: FAD-dependent monooxygenase [Pseudomonadota bacterium]